MCSFLLRLENIQSFIQMKNNLCDNGLNKFYYTSSQMGIPCIKCVIEEYTRLLVVNNKFSKLTADSIFKIFYVYIADKTDHQNCIHVFCIQLRVALGTVNPKI